MKETTNTFPSNLRSKNATTHPTWANPDQELILKKGIGNLLIVANTKNHDSPQTKKSNQKTPLQKSPTFQAQSKN